MTIEFDRYAYTNLVAVIANKQNMTTYLKSDTCNNYQIRQYASC